MKTTILKYTTRDEALKMLKWYLCASDRMYVHTSYFFDEKDEQHTILMCYY